AGQTLQATPVDGAWSVTAAILPNGTYPVTASVQDGAGNPGSTTQQLTVDTVLPLIAIEGGTTRLTNDPTPTISGTSDVAEDTFISVTIGTRSLRALALADGTWNVTPASLPDGTHEVTATVKDLAGNESAATQTLAIDTTAPVVTIDNGASALTNDNTPTVTGTADVDQGSTVTVTVANETLTGQVGSAGAWSVTASHLSDGPHRFVLSATDGAGNPATATQMLTIDTVEPVIAINGGAVANTSDVDPTIAGTSDGAPGTTVTVSIAGRTLTTLIQADGSWNTNPGLVGEGTWPVLASTRDLAGNIGNASQTLNIGPAVITPTHALKVTRTGNGQGTVRSSPAGIECGPDCSATYPAGTPVTLTAEPATGSDFKGWSKDCPGDSTVCTVTTDQARDVETAFTLQKRSLALDKTDDGDGEVSTSPAGIEFDYGTTVTLTARAAPGSTFMGWGGACSGKAACAVKMDRSRAVSARFVNDAPAITKFRLTPAKVRLGGRSKTSIRRRGPVIKVKLTEASKVRIRVTRKFNPARTFQVRLKSGQSRVRIPVKIRRKLKRGDYRLKAVATDALGRNSKNAQTRLKVVL
ncbi:MAG: Ig-like domain-containing protein, partial [Actinomycetota bacterium]|nr:Ig-like domain-containing protein [Actinomycetota bacterium]